MRPLLPIALIVAAVLTVTEVSAAGRRFKGKERSASGLAQRLDIHPPVADRDAYRAWANERYPKYIGGIHVRELDRFGLPPGDRGLRGNGFYATPW